MLAAHHVLNMHINYLTSHHIIYLVYSVDFLVLFFSASAFSALALLVGHEKEHMSCKKLCDEVWVCGYLSDCLHVVQLMPLHPKTPSSLASFNSKLFFNFWYQLTHIVLEKKPLNGCNSSSSSDE